MKNLIASLIKGKLKNSLRANYEFGYQFLNFKRFVR